mgnify:CR=1 FL=1
MPIIRIVKMTFQPEKVSNFRSLFGQIKDKIRGFEGCINMSAYNEIGSGNVIFTYSIWESMDSLENYRKSDLFRTTWTETKSYFSEPAQAWSLETFE